MAWFHVLPSRIRPWCITGITALTAKPDSEPLGVALSNGSHMGSNIKDLDVFVAVV
jgi:hypothetical protein